MKAQGGLRSILYVLKKSLNAGGVRAMWSAMRSKNACKTCALGMGGQEGGMVNEAGAFPEFCKKSVQAMAADMQGAITEEFFERYSIQQLSAMSPRELESCGRLAFPLFAGPLDTHYTKLSWDDALAKTSTAIRDVNPEHTFYYLSGRSSNEAGFLMQLAARIRGTNNINNCSYYCHQASGVGLTSVTGSGTATVQLQDLKKCDTVFLIGCNPASNHPRLLKSLVDLRRRGGRVVVINPMRERGLCRFKVPSDLRSLLFGSKISDLYIQPNIGGDSACFLGILKWLVENNCCDDEFVRRNAEGFEAVVARAKGTDWNTIEEDSGVEKQDLVKTAKLYAESKGTVFCWAMGITHVKGGVDSVRMIANVAIARGMVGREGAGLLPLRGHSNVQGMGTVGVVPRLKESTLCSLEQELGVNLNREGTQFQGDTMACMNMAERGAIEFAMCMGGNLVGSNPDTKFAIKAMANINVVTYMSTTLNQGHFLGRGRETIVLPVCARDEESQVTTQESMFNFVRRSAGGARRHEGARSEVGIIVELAEKSVGQIDWAPFREHQVVRALMEKCIVGFDANSEHQIKGRTFHTKQFATESGKIIAHDIVIPRRTKIKNNQLRLMTVRSEGQFNTVVYEEEDVYRGQTQRDIVLMNTLDIEAIGLEHNKYARIRGNSEELQVLVRSFDIKRGNCAMYFPEANILLGHEVDEESKTPLFKGAIVELFRCVDT
ncbi:MAG: FdhF/YdeP family oxidoreductase [Phycisphaerales bacterium]|jgi:molybdopterin-dependent oxidoreductase alpha subunit|nr:FdhF/YdeP family oxidoreductase [Phycisphaerales bacterium]